MTELLTAVGAKDQDGVEACAEKLRHLAADTVDDRNVAEDDHRGNEPSVSEDAEITQTLEVSQDAEITETIEVSQDAEITETIEVDEDTAAHGHFTPTGRERAAR